MTARYHSVMSTSIQQSSSTELDELVLLVSGLNANQREYFFALARGEAKEDAIQVASVSPATVDSWPYQGRTADAFKRVRDIVRDNPRAKEQILDYFIRVGTKLSVAEEVWQANTNGKLARTDVLRLGAEMSGALNHNQSGPQIVNLVLSESANAALAQAAHQKYERLNSFETIDLPGEPDGS